MEIADSVCHLATEEDFGESKTNGVTEFVEVLVLPLSLSIHDFVVIILSIDNKVVLNVENEIPRIGESLGHLAELVKKDGKMQSKEDELKTGKIVESTLAAKRPSRRVTGTIRVARSLKSMAT